MQTGAVDSISAHPIQFYYEFGCRVTINTDNRLITNTTVSDEIMLWVNTFDASVRDVREIIINGFKSAFQSYRTRQDMLSRYIAEMDTLIAADTERYAKETGDKDLGQVKKDRRGTSQKFAERKKSAEAVKKS